MKDHKCLINYEESSSTMESKVALALTERLFGNSNGRLYIEQLVSDDDSSMRSILLHKSVNQGKG